MTVAGRTQWVEFDAPVYDTTPFEALEKVSKPVAERLSGNRSGRRAGILV